jgi:hypothetical protein
MFDETNPAGRLYRILGEAKSQPQNQKVRQVWAKALDCDENDDAEISRRVVEVYSLSKEVKGLIELLPDLNHELYLKSYERIDKAIFPLNLNSSWQGQQQALSDDLLARLQFCAEELGRHYSEETLSDEDLAEVDSLISELFTTISQGDIEIPLRMALLEELEKIRRSLAIYRIKGGRGVKEALQSLLGAVVVNKDALSEAGEKNPAMLRKLGSLVEKLDAFTARALRLHKVLSGPIGKALGFLTTGSL